MRRAATLITALGPLLLAACPASEPAWARASSIQIHAGAGVASGTVPLRRGARVPRRSGFGLCLEPQR